MDQILILNQIDKNNSLPQKDIDEYGRIKRIELSAKTGQGIEFLKEALVGRASALTIKKLLIMTKTLVICLKNLVFFQNKTDS